MEPNEMEAESGKYSNRAVIILPLHSGKFAIFNNRRQLQAIVDGHVLLEAIAASQCEAPVAGGGADGVHLSLNDLGL